MRRIAFKTGENEQEYARWHVRELFEGKGWGELVGLCLHPEDWNFLCQSKDNHILDGDDLIGESRYKFIGELTGDWDRWWKKSTGYLGEHVFLCPMCAIEIGVAVIEEVPDVQK